MHSTAFKLCTALTVVVAAFLSYRIYVGAEINELWFMLGSIVFAVLIATVIGNEISKCIRNKISTGHTKTQVYVSELLLANIFVTFLFVIFLVLTIALNFRLFSHISLKLASQTILGFFCMSLLFANVFASLSCIISSKTGSIIVCLVLIIALFITSGIVTEMLKENEFKYFGKLENDEMVHFEVKNPNYVEEPWRTVLTFYRDANPYGQRAVYEDILLPFLFDTEKLEKAQKATENTIGNDHLKREISESEQKILNKTPFDIIIPIPFLVFIGWSVFRKKELK